MEAAALVYHFHAFGQCHADKHPQFALHHADACYGAGGDVEHLQSSSEATAALLIGLAVSLLLRLTSGGSLELRRAALILRMDG